MTAPTATLPIQQRMTPSIAFPLVLISLGVAFLLANLGYLRGVSWAEILRLWPVLLVLAGVDVLLRPRSFAAAAVVEIAIVAVTFAYLLTGASAPAGLTHQVDVPRAAATELSLTVNYGAGALSIAGGGTALVSVRSSHEDVERSVDQNGAFAGVVVSSGTDAFIGPTSNRRWDITLPSDVRAGMTLNLAAGDFDIDLSQVQLTRATNNAGASDTTVTLPRPKGNVPVTISTGASQITIVVPQGVAYAVNVTGVMHSISGSTQSADYASAADRVTITLSAAMSSVTIR
jgi:hypothetical protein